MTVTVASTDVGKSIPNASLTGVSSVLIAPALVISDIHLILTNVTHTSVPDLHIELWSPVGAKVVLMRAFTEPNNPGILVHTFTPDNFINVTLDDQAPTSLADSVSSDHNSIIPGSYNLNHPSVVANPLSQFNGQNSLGTWTLFIQDLAAQDRGSLNAWSLQITGEPIHEGSCSGDERYFGRGDGDDGRPAAAQGARAVHRAEQVTIEPLLPRGACSPG